MSENQNDKASNIVIEDLLKEKRADRRWKTIRSIAWLLLIAYIFFNLFNLFSGKGTDSNSLSKSKYVSLVHLDGMIAPGREFSAQEIIPQLKEAFSDKQAEGVVIVINSPRGTPVQAAIIHDALC